jgi:hypothetical protein
MKSLFRFLTAIALATACFLAAPPALGQTAPSTSGNFSSTNAVPGSTTDSVASAGIDVPNGRGLGILSEFYGANVGTGNVTITFGLSQDGTDWTTTATHTQVIAANGTNWVRAFKNFAPADLDNVRYIRVNSIANAVTNAIAGVEVKYIKRNP